MTARKNWLTNPGLELGSGAADSWLPTGVDLSASGAIATPKTNHDTGYLGAYSWKFEYTIDPADPATIWLRLGDTAAASFAPADLASALVRLYGNIPTALRLRAMLAARKSDGSALNNVTSPWVTALTGWQPLTAQNLVAAALTDHVRLYVNLSAVNGGNIGQYAGEVFTLWFDCPIVEKAASVGTWFSGDFGGAWDGSANASTSQQTQAAITQMTSSGPVGGSCTIDGTGFGLSGGVTFAGTAATITSWSPTEITCIVPNVAGTPSVVVTPAGDGGGTASNGATFTIAAVGITSVSPGDTLTPGQTVIINGSQFGTAGVVTFGTTAASVLSWKSDGTQVTCVVPWLAPGSVSIYVTPSGGSTTAGHSVTILPVPFRVKRNALWELSPDPKVRKSGSWEDVTSQWHRVNGTWVKVGITPPVVIVPPTGNVITVSPRTQAAFDAACAQANAGDTIYCPGGDSYTRTSASSVSSLPDYVHLTGDGIYYQGVSGGGGGTWLQFPVRWGSWSNISKMLIGTNTSTCQHYPQPLGTSTSWSFYTNAHGSTGCVFSFVRFKGGSTGNASLIDFASNFGALGWSTSTNPLRKYSLINTQFNDCEFERPTTATVSSGDVLNMWWDCRNGGAQMYGIQFNRCHLGVKNSATGLSGADRYGMGRGILFQPAPDGVFAASPTSSPTADTGPNMQGGSQIYFATGTAQDINRSFDWSQVEHGAHDISFVDCLFEYSLWYPLDICDAGRPYSMWHGIMAYLAAHPIYAGGSSDIDTKGYASAGYGNPPGSQWTSFPAKVWTDSVDFTRCYAKGSAGGFNTVFEMGRNCNADYCQGITVSHSGSYGNTSNVHAFANANRPHTVIFPTDWAGTLTAYTPSPFDPN
jgi:hypothetical protein